MTEPKRKVAMLAQEYERQAAMDRASALARSTAGESDTRPLDQETYTALHGLPRRKAVDDSWDLWSGIESPIERPPRGGHVNGNTRKGPMSQPPERIRDVRPKETPFIDRGGVTMGATSKGTAPAPPPTYGEKPLQPPAGVGYLRVNPYAVEEANKPRPTATQIAANRAAAAIRGAIPQNDVPPRAGLKIPLKRPPKGKVSVVPPPPDARRVSGRTAESPDAVAARMLDPEFNGWTQGQIEAQLRREGYTSWAITFGREIVLKQLGPIRPQPAPSTTVAAKHTPPLPPRSPGVSFKRGAYPPDVRGMGYEEPTPPTPEERAKALERARADAWREAGRRLRDSVVRKFWTPTPAPPPQPGSRRPFTGPIAPPSAPPPGGPPMKGATWDDARGGWSLPNGGFIGVGKPAPKQAQPPTQPPTQPRQVRAFQGPRMATPKPRPPRLPDVAIYPEEPIEVLQPPTSAEARRDALRQLPGALHFDRPFDVQVFDADGNWVDSVPAGETGWQPKGGKIVRRSTPPTTAQPYSGPMTPGWKILAGWDTIRVFDKDWNEVASIGPGETGGVPLGGHARRIINENPPAGNPYPPGSDEAFDWELAHEAARGPAAGYAGRARKSGAR